MLSLDKHDQAWWVGLRSTFYRTAMIVGSGLLVVLAGVLESRNGLAPVGVQVQAKGTAEAAPVFTQANRAVIRPAAQHILASPDSVELALGIAPDAEGIRRFVEQARAWNREHGFTVEERTTDGKREYSWWIRSVSGPLGAWLGRSFPRTQRSEGTGSQAGNLAVIYFSVSEQPTKELAIHIARKLGGLEYFGLGKGDRGFRLVEGERLTFNAKNWTEAAVAVIQLDPKLKTEAAVTFLATAGDIPLAWSITLLVVSGLFLAFSCWHILMLPRPANDRPVLSNKSLLVEFFATLGSFFKKPGVLMAMAFILLYRFDEAQLVKVISPFLLDSRGAGGLGLTTSQVGLVYGTFGILALTCGGLLGGFSAAKHGLKTMLPIMVCSMYLPKLAFIFLSFSQPENFLVVCGAVAVEQFGYGFGFTAFMLYLLYFADGPHKTAHYAICTGFMALGMMIPGMWSGWVADHIGYRQFFVWASCCALPGFTVAMRLKVDPQFGKKTAESVG